MFILPAGTEDLTQEKLRHFLAEHKKLISHYKEMEELYKGDHPILHKKETTGTGYKPDNRLVVNYAKYITDTFNGYFIGIPVKVSHPDDEIDSKITTIGIKNGIDDHNAELAKSVSIYGTALELLYMNEDSEPGIVNVNPKEGFIVYDDSLLHKRLFGVRYFYNTEGKLEGSYSTNEKIYYFDEELRITGEQDHAFGEVPLLEYNENEEKLGTFETVQTLIEAYDKAISEKANDVDYYADAYLKIIGPGIDEKTMNEFRQTRLIHAEMDNPSAAVIEFLAKPEADTTQENLIDRLEDLIFTTSMVANINDDSFGSASGVALAYKLQPMSNLAMTKERKFTANFQKRYKMLMGLPTMNIGSDEWIRLEYRFTRNNPKNLLEESQIAGNLAGITSEETQLSVLSIVDDPKKELEKKEDEQEEASYSFTPDIINEPTDGGTGGTPEN